MNIRNRWNIAGRLASGFFIWVAALVLAAGLGLSTPADASKPEDAKCLGCHDDSEYPPPTMIGERPWILSLGRTKHGVSADGRTPGCATCHGESQEHMRKRGAAAPDRVFKQTTPAEVKNEPCAGCHKGSTRMFWHGSVHQSRGVACVTCHDIHNGGHDKVRDKVTQTEVCFTCHKEQRAQINRPSHHPIREGKMACSDCHNPHGSAGPKQLKKDSVNETCYTCHTEKRGPFLHNHQPVTEDCTICHNAHGTTVANLLKARPPFLCQQCHSHTSHPGQVAALPTARATGTTALGTVGRGCLNCHTNIHGGNSTQNSATAGRFRR